MNYRRILLKISGESLGSKQGMAFEQQKIDYIANEIKKIYLSGIKIGIVFGGGNIFRGLESNIKGVHRSTSDSMGMLATVMNGLLVRDTFNNNNLKTVLLASKEISGICEASSREKANKYLEEGNIVIFAGGSGLPYFTTDTATVLKALEMDAEIVLKATKVDGVYNKDPKKFPDAMKYDKIGFEDCLNQKLQVMDLTAFSLCMENNLPIIIFDFFKADNLKRVLSGEETGSYIGGII